MPSKAAHASPLLTSGVSAIRSGVSTNGLPEFRSEMKQPENPAQTASQSYERTTETELPLASGTKVTETVASRDDRGQPVTREKSIVLTEPTLQKTRVTEKAETVIGAALAVGAWFLAHRHGRLRGMVDANKNGVGDRWNVSGKRSTSSRAWEIQDRLRDCRKG